MAEDLFIIFYLFMKEYRIFILYVKKILTSLLYHIYIDEELTHMQL